MEDRIKERYEYLKKKRIEVLEAIKPLCDYFKIQYDYIIKETGQRETLILNGQKIGCSENSISEVINEVIGYIFAKIYCKDRYIGAFKNQTLNVIKEYWIKE